MVATTDGAIPATEGGWLHTGDIGWLDEEGYLWISDRRDDLVVSGGENIYPAEVEAALLAYPAVLEAAVVGLPDEQWGQLVTAVVVLREPSRPIDLDELSGHLRQRLAGFKLPRRVSVSAEPLPRTASGKLQRHLVRAAFGSTEAAPG